VKRNVVEGDGRAAFYQRLGFRMVAQFVRKQQGRYGFRQSGEMLGYIDQRDGEVARRAQDRKSQGTDQHDVTGSGSAVQPKYDDPGQQRDRQRDRNRGVRDP